MGRDNELADLIQQYKRVESGRGAVVLVRGAAGLGKSRVVNELVGRSTLMGAIAMVGRATPYDRGLPYGAFVEALNEHSADLPQAVADSITELAGALSTGLVPLAAAPPRRQLHEVHRAAVRVFQHCAEVAPLVLVVEDLHFADPDSVALLLMLSRELRRTRTMLVCTARPSATPDVTEFERRVSQLAAEDRGAVVDLVPLDRPETHALLADQLKARPDAALVNMVEAASRGNPFLTIESTHSLVAANRIVITDGRARLTHDHPALPSRGAALAHRFFLAGSTEVKVARVLAAFGRVSLRHLPVVVGLTAESEERVVAAFDQLVAESLLVQLADGCYEFAHSILRDTLHDETGPAERRRIHRAIVDAMVAERDTGLLVDPVELAIHLERCAEPGDAMAVTALMDAGRVSARSAPLAAARWFAKAAELSAVGSVERGTALAYQTRALSRASLPQAAAQVGLLALGHEVGHRGRLLADTVESLYIAGDIGGAVSVIETEAARVHPAALPAPLLAQLAHYRAQMGLADDGSLLAEVDVDALAPAEQVAVFVHLFHRAEMLSDAVESDRCRAALERPAAEQGVGLAATVRGSLALADSWVGRNGEVRRHLEAAASRRADDVTPSIGGQLEAAAVVLAWNEGRWDDALQLANDTVWDLERRHVRVLAANIRLVECEIHLSRGDFELGYSLASELAPVIQQHRNHAEAVKARALASMGRIDEAWTVVASLESESSRRTPGRTFLAPLTKLVVAWAGDDMAAAEQALDEMEATAHAAAEPMGTTRLMWARGLVRSDPASARASYELATTAGLPYSRAQAALLAGSLGVDPAELLPLAYLILDDLGAVPLRYEASARLRAHRLPVPRRTAPQHGALSAVESDLVRLLCEGMTNRDIARAMSYSPKTIEVYLTRVYAKTGCRTRLELVRAVDRGDVVLSE